MPEEKDPSPDMGSAEIEGLAEKWLGGFKNRTIYRRLDRAVKSDIPDDKLWQAILDFIGLEIRQNWENDVEKVPQLGPGFSAAYFLAGLDIEVNNGGFNQFFFNRGREVVELAKQGAEFLQLPALAGIISKALEIEIEEREKMARVRKAGTLEAFFKSYDHISFDCVDDAFMTLDLDLERAVVSFVRGHGELFEGQTND